MNRVIAGKAFVVLEAINRTGKVLNQTYRQFVAFGAKIQAIGATMMTRALAAATPQAVAIKVFSDFDDIMRKVEARSTGTAKEMSTLREQARQLGRTTAFTARQIAGLMDILAQRGFTRSQMFDMTPNVLNLARAGGTGNLEQDALDASNLISGALRGYQMEASEAARVADLFTYAVNESNFDLQDLIISMANASSITRLYNISLEETLALLSVMRDVNIDPSVAGTGLRNILLKASAKKGAEEFNMLMERATGKTIEFRDELGNLRRPAEILFSMFDAMRGLGTAQQGDLLSNLFGLRAIIPSGATLPQMKRYQHLMDGLFNSMKIAENQAKMMDAGIGGSFRRIRGAAESIALSFGSALETPLQALSMTLRDKVVLAFDDWIKANKRLMVQIVMITTGVLALGAALFILGMTIKVIALILPVVSGMLFTFVALKAILVTGFTILITALIAFKTIVFGIATALITMAGAAISGMAAFIGMAAVLGPGGVLAAILLILFALKSLPTVISGTIGVFRSLFSTIASGFSAAAQSIMSAVSHITNAIGSIAYVTGLAIDPIMDAIMSGRLESAWKMFTSLAKVAFLEVKNATIKAFYDIYDAIVTGITRVMFALNTMMRRMSIATRGMIQWSRNDYMTLGAQIGKLDPSNPVSGIKESRTAGETQRVAEIWGAKAALAFQIAMFKLMPEQSIIDKFKEGVSTKFGSFGTPPELKNLVKSGVPNPIKGASMPDAVEKGTAAAMKAFYQNQNNTVINQLQQANQHLANIADNMGEPVVLEGKR